MIQARILASLLAASLFSFYNLFIFSLMNVLGVYLKQDLSLTQSSLGLLSSWDLWGNVIGFIPIGILIDSYNVRRVGLVLLSLTIAATLTMAYVHTLWLFGGLRFLQGLASAGSLLITMRLGSRLFPKKANSAIGFMILLALSGGIAGNSLFAYLAAHYGWRQGLIFVVGIGLICLIFMMLFLQEDKISPKANLLQRYILGKRPIWAGLHLGLLNTPVFILGSLFGNQYIMHQTNLGLQQSAHFSSLLFFGIIAGSPIIGYLADKMGSFRFLLVGYSGLILCSAILSLDNHLSGLLLLTIFFGLGFSSCTQNLIYPLIYQNQSHLPSTDVGIAAVVANVIGASLQIMFGILTQITIPTDNLGLKMIVILFVIGLISLCRYSNPTRLKIL